MWFMYIDLLSNDHAAEPGVTNISDMAKPVLEFPSNQVDYLKIMHLAHDCNYFSFSCT